MDGEGLGELASGEGAVGLQEEGAELGLAFVEGQGDGGRGWGDGGLGLGDELLRGDQLWLGDELRCGRGRSGCWRGRDLDVDGAPRFTCTLSAGTYQRTWSGSCLGEALAGALLARWGAMDRKRGAGGKRGGAEAPRGWVRAMAERAR